MVYSITFDRESDEEGNNRDKVDIVCECGIKIFGNSIDNATANLKIHQKSKRHKNILNYKKNKK